MACAVIISHPSEIIRKGIFSILENEVDATVLCFENLYDVKEHLFVTYNEIAFVLPLEENQSEILTNFRFKSNEIFVIGIITKNTETAFMHFDYLFNIDNPAQELVQHIKQHLNESITSVDDEELSTREKEVLRLIAMGQTNKSIADTLYISTHTVISHRKNITDKLGIKSIPGLTVYAIIQKIVSQADISKTQLT